ncbi:MAG: family 78 glycoside hydrolase catalytic domain [Acidobacteria bacterium]|nr:family 78 glycoside hydrolase catalytic domain [Acidobacteriota bacterium]
MKQFVCWFMLTASVCAAALAPAGLRCEYRKDPVGIDDTAPRLSWQLTAANPAARNLRQSAYRIQAASTPELLAAGKGDLWDTARVESGQSVLVPYGGQALRSGQPVWWRVMVWDQAGQASGWSAAGRWSMGLLNAAEWKGKWIGKEEKVFYKDPHSPFQALKQAQWIWFDEGDPARQAPAEARYFRAHVTLPAGRTMRAATLLMSADNSFELTINGQKAGRGSDTALPAVLDAAPFLKTGENTLAVTARNRRADAAGLIAALQVDFTMGGPLVFTTGPGWQAARSEGGEFQPARMLGQYGMAPWGEVGLNSEQALPARMLRKEFEAPAGLKRATVYVSGLGSSEFYVNGAKVSDHVLSPGLTDYEKRVLYVTHDITALLKPGRNAAGVILGNGRYYAPRRTVPTATRSFGTPRALVQIELEAADGTKTIVASDETWKVTAEGPVRVNSEYDGEEYDARMEAPGWARPAFDDSGWQAAEVVTAPAGALRAQMAEPLKVTETLAPKSLKQIRPGVWIYDFGQNMVGWCRLKAAGPAGTRVQLRHAETLRPDGNLYVDNLRSARSTSVYWLKGGAAESWEPRFSYHGFRFVELTGFPGTPTLAALEGRVVHDAMTRTGDWESSSALLNQIHRNILWGMRGNYRSIPTDCPQRDEKQGWLGDRSIESRSESYLHDVGAFYTKWVADIEDSQRPTGSIPDVAPAYWPFYNDGIVWPSTFILAPQMVYEQYGDRRILERHYPAMKKWVEYMRGFMKDGLMPKNTYGDWCVPPEDPQLIHSKDPARVTAGPLLSTAYFYHIAGLMSRYARVTGHTEDVAGYDALAAQLQAAFLKAYYKPQEGRFDNGTQTSSVLPLAFGLVPEEARGRLTETLVTKISKETNNHVGVGLVGAQWLMRALSDNGQAQLAYTIASQRSYPGWGYMVDKGATTIWELWNGDTADPAMNSGNHVMQIGDLGLWLYEYLAGIRSDPEKPGFAHVIVKPYAVPGLTHVKASHQSPYGVIGSAWRRTAGTLTLAVTVPPNTTATIYVPGTGATEAAGLKAVRTEGGATVFETGSGSYSFTVREGAAR